MTEDKPIYETSNVQDDAVVAYHNVPLTKAGQDTIGARLAAAIAENGDEDALTAYMRLKAMANVIENAIAYLVPHAMEEAEKYSVADAQSLHGVGFNVSAGAAKWDYSVDAEWNNLKAAEAAAAEARKAHEKLIKSLDKPMVDPETGEMLTPAVQESLGNRQLRITFPKI